KRLFNMERKLVASPDYMAEHKTPQRPNDLISWDWIGLAMRPHLKTFANTLGETSFIQFEPRIIADSVDAVAYLAIAGLGLATPPSFLVAEAIHQGLLVEPLPAWHVESMPVYAVWPPNASKDSLTFKLLAFLEDRKKYDL
ncbi:MAG: LysR substrate-binding domain-containing protein, partial [Legionellaceae bacterium]